MLTRRQELRKSSRRPFRCAAWLSVGGDRPPIRCVLRDISDGGARVEAPAHLEGLPDRFTLILAQGAVRRPCELVWRNDRFVGVKFIK